MRYSTVKKTLSPFFGPNIKEVNGSENIPESGPYIIAANHVDYLDGFFVALIFEKKRKHDVFFLSKTNNYWWAAATLPIDPNDKTKSIEDAVNYLKNGKIICNFIEGRRNREKYLQEGKTGTARLALMAKVPILPVGIICPSPRRYSKSVYNLLMRKHKAIINIGQPVAFEKYYSDEITRSLLKNITHDIMRNIAPLCGKAYAY